MFSGPREPSGLTRKVSNNSPRGVSVGVALSSATARGQDIYVTNQVTGTIGEYSISGGTVNASLVSGLNNPAGIAVSGSDLFVTNWSPEWITPARLAHILRRVLS